MSIPIAGGVRGEWIMGGIIGCNDVGVLHIDDIGEASDRGVRLSLGSSEGALSFSSRRSDR